MMQQFTALAWRKIDGGQVRGEVVTVRGLYAAICAEMVRCWAYNPETDVRVKWLREVLACEAAGKSYVELDRDLKFVAGFACGCVKMPKSHWQEMEEKHEARSTKHED